MSERYIVVSDGEYCYTLDTQSDTYKTLEDYEKQEFEDAKKNNIDIKEYADEILESASDKYWEWIYDNYLDPDAVTDIMNTLTDENEQLKQQIENTIREADNMDCNCNPCVVEECVTKVIQR